MPRIRVLPPESSEPTAATTAAESPTTTAATEAATPSAKAAAGTTLSSGSATRSTTRTAKVPALHRTHERAGDISVREALPLHIPDAIAQIILAEAREPIDLPLLSAHRNRLRRR
jgi:hypothetical protein